MRFTRRRTIVTLGMLLATMLASCAPAPSSVPTAAQSNAPTASQPTGPKGTLRIAWGTEPTSLAPKMAAPGATAFNELAVTFNSALTYRDPSGQPVPLLARELPSVANGDWIVNADGTMVTTYHLRDGLKWHDGAPLTAHDFAFAFEVYLDRDVPVYRRDPETSMAGVDAPDERTVVIRWTQPFYAANALFYRQLDPLPSHLMEERYRSDKLGFVNSSLWTTDYVGSGPFRLERWEQGSRIVAQAFADWALGSPKAATLDIRFILDGNTILANLLAGELDVSGHPWVGPSLAASAKDRWVGGGMGYIPNVESRLEHMDFQYQEVPDWQPAVRDMRVRQALLSAIDRSALNDVVNAGIGGSVADMFLLRSDALFPDVDRAVAKYPYDVRRVAQLLTEAGWSRSQADAPWTNATGQTLRASVWGSASASQSGEASTIANNWRDAGFDASEFSVPAARESDAEFARSFPVANLTNRPILPEGFIWISSNIPTAQNRFLGANRGGFLDDQVDALQARLMTSLRPDDFRETTVALHKRMTEIAGTAPTYYPPDVMMVRNNVKGPLGHYTYPCHSWNIWQWEIVS